MISPTPYSSSCLLIVYFVFRGCGNLFSNDQESDDCILLLIIFPLSLF